MKSAWESDPEGLLRAGPGFSLAAVDPGSTPGFAGGKKDALRELTRNRREFGDLQERLWAESKVDGTRKILLVLQAMDTAGKGGIIRTVFRGVDPQGVRIHAFGAPTDEEKKHDFLWRIRVRLPSAGLIGVFDRSHYEDVLIHRVHGLSSPEEIENRYGVISAFEQELVADDTTVIKVMLHITPKEQRARLMRRLVRPDKHWKYNRSDLDERLYWPDYMEAYQLAIERTSTDDAPWFVVPADHKWYARLAVQALVFNALRRLDPQWPSADFDVETEKERLAANPV